MSEAIQKCRVLVFVKALPQRSAKHGETVCCAGVTANGEFKRLYPVRFRHLRGDNSFSRWDWIDFKYGRPVHDGRKESCRVFEDSINVVDQLSRANRASFLNTLVSPSIRAAADRDASLALLRPRETRFFYKRKSADQLREEKETYMLAASQGSLFDADLAALQPTPFEFKFRFRDQESAHEYTNADWEAHAMFYRELKRTGSERETLDRMDHVFNKEYPSRGMMFAVGNQAKRPQTWQLLGVLRVDDLAQQSLAL